MMERSARARLQRLAASPAAYLVERFNVLFHDFFAVYTLHLSFQLNDLLFDGLIASIASLVSLTRFVSQSTAGRVTIQEMKRRCE